PLRRGHALPRSGGGAALPRHGAVPLRQLRRPRGGGRVAGRSRAGVGRQNLLPPLPLALALPRVPEPRLDRAARPPEGRGAAAVPGAGVGDVAVGRDAGAPPPGPRLDETARRG